MNKIARCIQAKEKHVLDYIYSNIATKTIIRTNSSGRGEDDYNSWDGIKDEYYINPNTDSNNIRDYTQAIAVSKDMSSYNKNGKSHLGRIYGLLQKYEDADHNFPFQNRALAVGWVKTSANEFTIRMTNTTRKIITESVMGDYVKQGLMEEIEEFIRDYEESKKKSYNNYNYAPIVEDLDIFEFDEDFEDESSTTIEDIMDLFDPANIVNSTVEETGDEMFDDIFDESITEGKSITWIEWRRQKERTLSRLKKNAADVNRYYSGDTRSKMLASINSAINTIQEDISRLNIYNNESVHKNIMSEIQYLKDVLDTFNLDTILETDVLERMNVLSKLFLSKDLQGNEEDFLSDFVTYQDIFGRDSIKSIIDALVNPSDIEKDEGLFRKFNRQILKLFESEIRNSPEIREEMEAGNFTEENLEELMNMIVEMKDIGVAEANFLGAGSVNNILTQLLRSYKERKLFTYKGHTKDLVQKLADLLRKVQKNNKDFTQDVFVQKSSTYILDDIKQQLGDAGRRVGTVYRVKNIKGMSVAEIEDYANSVNDMYNSEVVTVNYKENSIDINRMSLTKGHLTGNLISLFGDHYHEFKKKLNNAKGDFVRSVYGGRKPTYEKVMNMMKENEDIIDIRKLKFFQQYTQKFPEFQQYFTFSDKEMEDYEKDLRNKLGAMYDDIIDEQLQKLKDFQRYTVQISVSSQNSDELIHGQNPFIFANHFESADYLNPYNIGNGNFYSVSNYISFIPKEEINGVTSNYYNQDFRENIMGNKDLYDMWSAIYELVVENINPGLNSAGYITKSLSLPMLINASMWEMIKDKGFLKGLGQGTKDYFMQMIANPLYANNQESTPKFSINYHNSADNLIYKRVELLMNNSLNDLANMAIDKDINIPNMAAINKLINDPAITVNKKNAQILLAKRRIATLIAESEVYQPFTKNIVENVIGLTELTNNLKARIDTESLANIILNYVRETKHERKNKKGTTTDRDSLNNLTQFIENWIGRNIHGDTIVRDRKDAALGVWSSQWGKTTLKTSPEKTLTKLYEEELKNMSGTYNFIYNDVEYKTTADKAGNKIYRKNENGVTTDLTQKEIEKDYEDYLNDKIRSLGIPINAGSMLVGMLKVAVQKGLSFNPFSGFKNRHEGMIKNDIFAASGRFGWYDRELSRSRRFLSFYNVNEIFGNNVTRTKEHAQQMDTFRQIFEGFGVMQNKANAMFELSNEKKRTGLFGIKALSPMWLAVDSAENHNQLESALSLLQTVDVEEITLDSEGNFVKRKYFEKVGNSMKFSMYIPGTMTLKPEFSGRKDNGEMRDNLTPEQLDKALHNIRVWEEFRYDPSGRNEHLAVLSKIKAGIERSQGNYSQDDIAAIFDNTIGKAFMMYQRYYAEHFAQAFGKKDFDLATATFNYEGRYRVMFKHAPTLVLFALLNMGMGVADYKSWTSFAKGGAIGLGLGMLTHYIRQRKNKELETNWQEYKIMAGAALEGIVRTITQGTKQFSKGRLGEDALIEAYMKFVTRHYTDAHKIRDRKQMSEGIAETAGRAKVVLYTMLTSLVTYLIWSTLVGGDDEEETAGMTEWEAEKYLEKKYNSLEGSFNKINNIGNFVARSSNFMDPKILLQEAGNVPFINQLNSLWLLGSAYNDYKQGYASGRKLIGRYLKSPLFPVPLPNTISSAFENGSWETPALGIFLEDDYQWNKHWYNDVWRRTEFFEKREGTKRRALFREQLRPSIEEHYRKTNPDMRQFEIDALVEKHINKLMDQGGVYGREEGELWSDYNDRMGFETGKTLPEFQQYSSGSSGNNDRVATRESVGGGDRIARRE